MKFEYGGVRIDWSEIAQEEKRFASWETRSYTGSSRPMGFLAELLWRSGGESANRPLHITRSARTLLPQPIPLNAVSTRATALTFR
jgi:hypothetical protein